MTESPWKSELHWVRPGQQDRSRKTQEALLEAAASLVAERGVDGTTIADIASAAGASVGAVYHHFRDKKAILYALFDRYSEMMQATTAQAVDPARWAGASITDILTGYLVFVLRHAGEASGFRQAGYHLIDRDESMYDRFGELLIELNLGLRSLMLDRVAEIGHPEPAVAVDFVLDQFSAMLRNRSTQPVSPNQLDKVPDEEWGQAMLESASAYLQLKQ